MYAPLYEDEDEQRDQGCRWPITLPCGCRGRCMCLPCIIVGAIGFAFLGFASGPVCFWPGRPIELKGLRLVAGLLFGWLVLTCMILLAVGFFNRGSDIAARIWSAAKITFGMFLGAVVGLGIAILHLLAL